jgi:tripartite-type tricarboxylate transporter receptor subunit TctC
VLRAGLDTSGAPLSREGHLQYRGIGVPKSTLPEARKRLSDLWAALNSDPEMKTLADKSGFELISIGTDEMDAFMKEKVRIYTEGAQRLGLGKK